VTSKSLTLKEEIKGQVLILKEPHALESKQLYTSQ
jgi:hypothetical protein